MGQLIVLSMFLVLAKELAKILNSDWLLFFEQFTHDELIITVKSS
jgi:hypothetical protein